MKTTRFQPLQAVLIFAASAALALSPFTVRAASSNWNIDAAGNWNAAGSWDTNGIPGATSGTTSTDIATFGFPLTVARTVTVDTGRNIGGITFANTSAFGYTLSSGSIFLSDGGVIQTASANGDHTDRIASTITIEGNAGSATFTAGATSAASLLTIAAVTGAATTGNTATLTLNGTNTGANSITGVIGNGSGGGTLAVVKSGSGNWLLSAANTFTGGLTIAAGTLTTSNAAALGAGTVTLGDSSGGSNAASLVTGSNSLVTANTITLAANTTGTLTIGTTGGAVGATFSGSITGNNSITFAANATSGNLSITGTVNNAGTVTNAGTGPGSTVITTIGSSVTGVTENSTTSALTVTTLNVNTGGTTLTNTAGAKVLTVTNAAAGTGNLILNNNSTLANGITLPGGANNTGSIINSGTGTLASPTIATPNTYYLNSSVLIAGIIGSNVTTVTQQSPTSALELDGANTFTGSAQVFAGSLILGAATAASTSQILVGDTSGSANASLLLRAFTLTNNILVQAGSSGTATIGGAGSTSGGSATLSGTVTLNKSVIFAPFNTSLTLSGLITGTNGNGITISAAGQPLSTSGQFYGIPGSTVILSKSDLTNTFTGDTTILAGALQLTGNATGNASLNGLLGTSTNAIIVGDTSGYQSARLLLNSGAAGQSLSRNIVIQAGSGGIIGIGQNSTNTATFSGTITLNKSVYLYTAVSGAAVTTYSGAITKGVNALGATSLTTSGTGVANLTNTGNNYDGGSTVGGSSILWGVGAGALGSGNIVAETGMLRLSDQLALASGRTVLAGPYGGVTIGANTAAQITYVASVLDLASSGGIGLGTNITNAINLASFGNGNMFFGSDVNGNIGWTYSATSLGADLDGNYRLGYGSPLTISTGVLVGNTAKVIVGNPVSTSQGTTFNNLSGSVILTGANTYAGGTDINIGSTLTVKQQASSGSALGDAGGALTMHGGNLILQDAANAATSSATTATTVGAFNFDGNSTLQIQGITSGGGNNTFTVGTITRNANGVLSISTATAGTLGTNAFFKTTGTVPVTMAVKAAGNTAVQMLPAYFLDNTTGNFFTYDATNGFTPINAYTSIASAVADGNSGVVRLTATEALGGDRTIAALGFLPAAAFTVTNSLGTDITLKITTGGINYAGANGFAVTLGSTTAGSRINLDFNGQEAIINSTGGGNAALTLNGAITNATGITKSGSGPLILGSTANTFVGNVNLLNGGTVQISSDLTLGSSGNSLNNGVVFDGGKLIVDSNGTVALSATRTFTIGTLGGTLTSKSSGNQVGNTVIVNSKITGTGNYLDVQPGAAGANANNLTSTYTFTNLGNDFTAPIFIGSANGSGLNGRMVLAFDTDSELGNSTNTVTLLGGSSVLRYTGAGAISSARGINFLEQGGALEVSSATGSLTESGTITGSGLFYKLGSGTLALTGSAATFSGSVNVTAGVLNVSNADALGATTATIAIGTSGVSGGAAYVQSGAALEVQGDIALGNTGGKTLYLNGDGINNGTSNGGALRNVSGSNSDTGAVILQSNTTIGTDSGTLSLSGVVSGTGFTLTKVGAGTLALSGANTYTGGTTVTAGTLLVNNTTGSGTGSGALSIGATATLGGSGSIAGITTIAGTLSPGNSPGVLTFNNAVTFQSGSQILIQINGSAVRGTDYDGVTFNGSVAATATTLTFNIANAIADNSTLDIFSGSSLSANFTSVALTGTGGYSGTLVLNGGNTAYSGTFGSQTVTLDLASGDLSFTGSAIPEPASTALLAASALLAFAALRRRLKHSS